MQAARWAMLKEIFHAASALPAAERSTYLKQACGDDADLRQEVEELLTSNDEDGEDGDGPTIDAESIPNTTDDHVALTEAPGASIGPYKLLEKIGEGGFGTVFMAEQERPIRRRVALKIIKVGMDTRRFVARFEAERQALALMEHPHIARVLDGGATESGRPYFVMELVRGRPMTAYCDDCQLSIRDRLALFMEVCHAVQHAHQKGVIHRDLKPSNILVSEIDGRHSAKVIDFGIAKALRERLTERTLFTEFHQVIGTPQYMSPEQAGGGLDVDTRSDVYSLGVLLYELLTGAPPFDIKRMSSFAEMQRAIREIEPPKPSTRVGSSLRGASSAAVRLESPAAPRDEGSSAIDIAKQRRTDPRTLIRQVRGELDWIVMKALEKDRARRYESPSALAADIERHLRNEPVQASPPSRWYRLRKLIRRNRTAFITGSVVVSAITLGLIGTLIGLLQAESARKAEAEQRSRAENSERSALSEAQRANEMAGFLKQTLLSVDPIQAQGHDTTLLRNVLDSTRKRIETELSAQPRTQAELALLIGQVYRQIGRSSDSAETLRYGLSILDGMGPDTSPELHAKMLLQLAWTLHGVGDFAGAEQVAREVLALDDEISKESRIETRRLLSGISRNLARYDDATSFTNDALMLAQQLDPANEVVVAACLTDQALIESDLERHEHAEELLRGIVDVYKARFGPDSLQVAFTLEHIATEQHEQHRYQEATATLQTVLDSLRKNLGDEHPRTANAKASLAIIDLELGAYPKARDLLTEAVATTRRMQGDKSRLLANHLMMLCSVLEALGERSAALDASRESVSILEAILPAEHPILVNALDRLARMLALSGDYEAALATTRRAITAASARNPGLPRAEVTSLTELAASILGDWSCSEVAKGELEHALEIVRQARATYEEWLPLREAALPAGDWQLADGRARLGLQFVTEADVLQRIDSSNPAILELLTRADPLCREIAERFVRDDSDVRLAFRSYYVPVSAERMVALYEVWTRIDSSPEIAQQLQYWRDTLDKAHARYPSAATSSEGE